MGRDMKMNTRYQAFDLGVTVHLQTKEMRQYDETKYVPARLQFNEDCDLVEAELISVQDSEDGEEAARHNGVNGTASL